MNGLIPPSCIDGVWGKIVNLISDACEYNNNRYSSSDYYSDLKANKKQLWLAFDGSQICGVIITRLAQSPNKKICTIEICTGAELSKWWEDTSLIEDWAKLQECDQMHLWARPGFEKLLRKLNYRKTHVLLEKDL